MKTTATLLFVLQIAPSLVHADGATGTGPQPQVTLERKFLELNARVTWDGAGTLEQSADMRRWRSVPVPPSYTGGRTRSVLVDLPPGTKSQFFRLQLPEPVDTDHSHFVREDLFPYFPNQLVEAIDPAWTLSRRLPVHQIRIHAIRTADSNGANRATILTAEIEDLIAQANTIFYRAGVEFLFDPATDLQDVDNSSLNRDVRPPNPDNTYTDPNHNPTQLGVTSNELPKRARADEALRHKGKLVVYFRFQKDGWQWNGTHWIPAATGWGFSSWAGTHVTMPPDNIGLNHLAHEIGHYLQNMHPFADEFTPSQAIAEMEAGIANGTVTADNALEVFNGDSYWVRDTPPDPSQKVFPGNGCNDPTVALNVDTDPGPGISIRTYTAAPDRLNLMSYFGDCENLGTRRLTPDMMDRLRDGLENGSRHALISQHIEGFFITNLTLADTYNGSAISGGISLLRTRWDQMVAVYRGTSGAVRLLSMGMNEAGELNAQVVHSTGVTGDSAEAVNMGLGLIALSIGSNSAPTEYRIYRVSETGTWQHLSTWFGEGIAGPVTMTRCGRVNFVTGNDGLGTSGNAILRLFETDANGLIYQQDQQVLRPGSSLSLGVVRANFLVTAMRGADGNLSVQCYEQSGERGASDLVLVGAGSAGAITSVRLVAHEFDRFTTAVRTGSGALKLILWEVDQAGNITRVAAGTDGPVNDFVTAGFAGDDIIATAARTPSEALSIRLWRVDPAGAYSDLITNGTEIQLGDSFDSLAVQLMRDRFIAVARRLGNGNVQIRNYRFAP